MRPGPAPRAVQSRPAAGPAVWDGINRLRTHTVSLSQAGQGAGPSRGAGPADPRRTAGHAAARPAWPPEAVLQTGTAVAAATICKESPDWPSVLAPRRDVAKSRHVLCHTMLDSF